MSVFTMTLQEAEEWNTEQLPKLQYYGLDTFPVAKEFPDASLFRSTLGNKIIDHYWNREIGLESFSMWRFNFRRLLNETMPYYNKLYVSELIQFDPLSTMNMTTTGRGSQESTGAGSSETNADSEAKARAISSTYPQTMLNVNTNGAYADNGNDSLVDSKNTANSTDTRNESANSESASTSKGYAGSAAALLTEYRSTLLNIDMMVIDRLEECFMQVLGSGDNYTGRGYFL